MDEITQPRGSHRALTSWFLYGKSPFGHARSKDGGTDGRHGQSQQSTNINQICAQRAYDGGFRRCLCEINCKRRRRTHRHAFLTESHLRYPQTSMKYRRTERLRSSTCAAVDTVCALLGIARHERQERQTSGHFEHCSSVKRSRGVIAAHNDRQKPAGG